MKLLATIIKELKLLYRDRAGLALLFIMPAFLVVAITLVQDKVTSTSVDVLFVDEDGQEIGTMVKELFQQVGTVRLVAEIDGAPLTAEQARNAVASGAYQFAVVLPENLTRTVQEAARRDVSTRLARSGERGEDSPAVPGIQVLFDPTVHGSFRAAVRAILQRVVMTVQTRLYVTDAFDKLSSTGVPAVTGEHLPSVKDVLPQLFTENEATQLIPLNEQFSSAMGFIVQPTAVQQNVPAWAIFGIFFICVPLAGAIINERRSGTYLRLRTMPVSFATLLCGKLIAYAMVCIVQFAVILLAGIWVLPKFGLPAFDPGTDPFLLAVVLAGIVTAACGYGVMLGILGKTYEQIAVFAPVSVVIAAAVGGIMVPVYAMPALMRPLAVISPLYWGQSGFYDVLLRGGNLMSVLPETGALLLFGLLAIIGSLFWSRLRSAR